MEFSSFVQNLESLHIQKGTISMPDVNTIEELGGIPRRIARPSEIVQVLINADPAKLKEIVNGHQG